MRNTCTIAWHQECLTNQRASTARKRKQLEELQAEITSNERDSDIYQTQIDKAILAGKESFDRDKYGIKKSLPKTS